MIYFNALNNLTDWSIVKKLGLKLGLKTWFEWHKKITMIHEYNIFLPFADHICVKSPRITTKKQSPWFIIALL